ncbi:unnamed protein product [Ceratitis capitata]|uniref:(Mediterranean fruit fly) hypothetical protein n=1 Tax=Ceratitis capitata TaxID=7213 RepID=A0A811V1I5_CERCA|nr:unnamed protein product [Ceratitis capitata]
MTSVIAHAMPARAPSICSKAPKSGHNSTTNTNEHQHQQQEQQQPRRRKKRSNTIAAATTAAIIIIIIITPSFSNLMQFHVNTTTLILSIINHEMAKRAWRNV